MPSPVTTRPAINLPFELSSFVGRRDELAAIKRRLGAARLLTLVGPGGVGKTRLALRSSRDVAQATDAAASFVSLAEVREPAGVVQSVVGALGLQDRSSSWSLPMLVESIGQRRLLLVLDNCEHVLDAAAVLAGTLLRACPNLRIIATSRQALGVAGELVEHVPAMSVPAAGERSTAEAVRSDGVVLFAERVTAVRPEFRLEGSNVAAIVELCRRLEGVPLALELAAVRLDAIGLDALVERLRERWDVLGTGDRSEPRQRTLDTTIDWSYQLLSPRERLLWSRLSVFAGGFELDAAMAVCADDALPGDEIPLLLAGLVEQSLVKRGEQGGHDRFRILEILRQFGAERLRESGGEPDIRDRHRAWIAALAASVAANDDRLVDLFGRVRSEGANLWSALGYSLEDGAIDVGVGVCRDLYNFWLADGGFSQVIGILRAFLERPEAGERTRADALWVSALIYTTMADADAGRQAASEALAVGRALGANDIVAWARIGLASALWVEGRWDEATAEAGAIVRETRTGALPYQELTALNILALAQRFGGDIDAAIDTGYEAIALSERLGEIWLRGYALHFLAAASLRAGKVAEAERLARDGLEIRRALGHVHGLGSLVEVLASVEIAKGDDERAATLLGGADAIWASISWRHTPANLKDHDAVRAGVLERLGRARYARAYAAGESVDRARLVDFALGRAVQPRADPATVRARPLLSPREMEVARLVADGASNAQVAGELFIGERTVESHVASIFNKIGVDSRVQVARWVAALDDASTGH